MHLKRPVNRFDYNAPNRSFQEKVNLISKLCLIPTFYIGGGTINTINEQSLFVIPAKAGIHIAIKTKAHNLY